MTPFYLGVLDHADPLYEVLLNQVCPDVRDPRFHVDRVSHRMVYRYTEEKTRLAIIGKFFRIGDEQEERVSRKKGEFDNLMRIRGYGFDCAPNYIVRPIGRDERIGLALIEEFVQGRDLDSFLKAAAWRDGGEELRDALSRLASFLFALHSRTETDCVVELEPVSRYFRKVVDKLLRQRVIVDDEHHTLLGLRDRWLALNLIQTARAVIIHGDATPTNFLFTEGGDVVAIDLERMRNCDGLYDVGMVCGELKHSFLWRRGDCRQAEGFIHHFLRCYADHCRDRDRAFRDITAKNPFYMALTELRIARNDYLDWGYRKRLACEAIECLRWGLGLS